MSNIRFTRDEVILALDVLYFHGNQRLNSKAPAIVELSDLLNQLPIHKYEGRGRNFRTPTGVLKQILTFQKCCENGERSVQVGKVFFEVATDYSSELDALHEIACAIRKNSPFFDTSPLDSNLESDSFPEGILLGRLHKFIEKRDSAGLVVADRCDICGIKTDEIYRSNLNLLSSHLMVPITQLDGRKRYSDSNYITVCPNCHSALHRSRPWLTKENYRAILR